MHTLINLIMLHFVVISALLSTGSTFFIEDYKISSEEFDVQKIQEEYEQYLERLDPSLKEDIHLLVPELVKKYGYPCEEHQVITEDGYILELHRIPYGKDGPSENRPAVFIQHGLLGSSADWVIPGPGQGLPQVLADHGYDVWLGNARGTRYSRKHVTLNPDKKKKKYWNFSWHEIAIYDIPAAVNYVTNATNQNQIYYIGHSQGTTVAYVMLSRLPEMNKRFRAVFTLAPAAYEKHMFSPLLRIIARFEKSAALIARFIGLYEFLPRTEFVALMGPLLCDEKSILQILCINAAFAVCGFNRKQVNTTLIPVFFGHTPAGAATKQFLHYGQLINSGKFREYDYGIFGNLAHYGRLTPPPYELKNVVAPVYIHYSRNDWISHEKDVNKLAGELGNLKGKSLVSDKRYNHLDYVIAMNAPDVLYKNIIEEMEKH